MSTEKYYTCTFLLTIKQMDTRMNNNKPENKAQCYFLSIFRVEFFVNIIVPLNGFIA